MAEDPEDMAEGTAPERERAELRRMIDALMAAPPRDWPTIIVVGDENVSAVYPLKTVG